MNIIFFNHFHYGDLHVSRTYINDIINLLINKNYNFYYYTSDFIKYNIFKDIKNLEWKYLCYINLDFNININMHDSIIKENNNIFINTWYAQSNWKYSNYGCSFYTLYNIFKDVYSFLDLEINDIYHYIPKINYLELNDNKTINFITTCKDYEKKILICNNDVLSGQSINFNFLPIIEELANIFPNYLFIITNGCTDFYDNIISTSTIYGQKNDLNETSYLSIYCDVIIGRSSGPYTYSIVQENLFDSNKIFICFVHHFIYSVGLNLSDIKCKVFWYNNYESSFIKNTIEYLIK